MLSGHTSKSHSRRDTRRRGKTTTPMSTSTKKGMTSENSLSLVGEFTEIEKEKIEDEQFKADDLIKEIINEENSD